MELKETKKALAPQGLNNITMSDDVARNIVKLDFNDILIKPSESTNIISRSEIDISDGNGMLPIFTAPMDTVVNSDNYHKFERLGINICLPRGCKGKPGTFKSYSLKQFVDKFINKKADNKDFPLYTLIDTANGHIKELEMATKAAKKLYGDNMTLMVGNVANANTYELLSKAGADYIRVGIGNGNGCLTTQQTGVGYPMASLIRECYWKSCVIDNPAKIVADGGMKEYSDIIKALALGADYVMLGSVLNKCLESCGTNYIHKVIPITQKGAEKAYSIGLNVYKNFRGMSTKEVQKSWGNKILKTSEGVTRKRKVEYTVAGWVDNFDSYLRSAMSYSDSLNLEEFVNKVELIKISENAYRRFKK
jgi:IMP dehydrogenase/GMP reductase